MNKLTLTEKRRWLIRFCTTITHNFGS